MYMYRHLVSEYKNVKKLPSNIRCLMLKYYVELQLQPFQYDFNFAVTKDEMLVLLMDFSLLLTHRQTDRVNY